MNFLPVGMRAAMNYEFRMAVRRRVLWLAVLPLLLLAVLIALTSPGITGLAGADAKVGTWAVIVNIFTSVGLGVVLADRFARTQRLGLGELLSATPASVTGRMVGALFGSLAAGLAPVAVAPVAVATLAVVPLMLLNDPGGILASPGWAAMALVTVILPASLLVTVAAATAALVLPLPLARVLTVLVWFWATVFNAAIVPLPTPTGTLISPLGDYVAAGWMHGDELWAGRGAPALLSPAVSAATAALNLAVIALLTVCLFAAARAIVARRA